jgi:hypothetical protein
MANTAQLAKLSYVDIYHPIADEEVVETALHLPWQQLIFERAYRRAMAVKFPDLARIIWTFTLTPPTISTMGLIRQKITHFTLGRWLKGTPLGNHPLIRPRRYFVDYLNWTRGELRQFVQETLISEEVEMLNVFDMDGLQKAIDEHMVGNLDITSFLGTAVAVALWSRNFYSTNTPRFLQAISQTK